MMLEQQPIDRDWKVNTNKLGKAKSTAQIYQMK